MRSIRFILSLIAILSVVNLCAATFGTTYQAQNHRQAYITQTGTSMPTATMSSMDAAMMSSGSTLPMAAISGTTTANDYAPAGPNRAKKDDTNGDGWEDEDDPSVPVNPNPLGDAALPLFLLALAFAIYKVRKRARV